MGMQLIQDVRYALRQLAKPQLRALQPRTEL